MYAPVRDARRRGERGRLSRRLNGRSHCACRFEKTTQQDVGSLNWISGGLRRCSITKQGVSLEGRIANLGADWIQEKMEEKKRGRALKELTVVQKRGWDIVRRLWQATVPDSRLCYSASRKAAAQRQEEDEQTNLKKKKSKIQEKNLGNVRLNECERKWRGKRSVQESKAFFVKECGQPNQLDR